MKAPAVPALTCFKTYDIRGRLGPELDEAVAQRIGQAFVAALAARRVVIGHDNRASSPALAAATVRGLMAGGAEVLDLGLCGTEEMYFATTHFAVGGGIEITASHNPVSDNGMKLVGRGSAPLDPVTEWAAMRTLAEADDLPPPVAGGHVTKATGNRAAYLQRVLGFVDVAALRPLKILVNAGNGTAGPTFDALATALTLQGAPLQFTRLHHAPDSSFPNGIPNPLLPENQPVTGRAVVVAGADLGVAWDGDFDRCFFFDHTGRFIPGEYIVGLLAAVFQAKEPGATIVHDPRIIWNTQDIVATGGGRAVQARTGHTFMKRELRASGAVYGGEMSAHHYFRDFMACDSGMIPWLLIAELISRSGTALADLVADRMRRFPSSGEVNFVCRDSAAAVARVRAAFAGQKPLVDETDGLSLAFADWRFNLRQSNTEPLLRLNIEARGQSVDLSARLAQLSALIR